MNVSRRQVLKLSMGVAAAGLAATIPGFALASEEEVKKAIAEFAGAEAQAGRVSLTVPEIAENGNNVPVSVTVESPMTADDYVQSVALFADGNPLPQVATFVFSPMSGQATATTRVRLAKTQNVIAVAKMSNGSVFQDAKQVKVTIGGCGG